MKGGRGRRREATLLIKGIEGRGWLPRRSEREKMESWWERIKERPMKWGWSPVLLVRDLVRGLLRRAVLFFLAFTMYIVGRRRLCKFACTATPSMARDLPANHEKPWQREQQARQGYGWPGMEKSNAISPDRFCSGRSTPVLSKNRSCNPGPAKGQDLVSHGGDQRSEICLCGPS